MAFNFDYARLLSSRDLREIDDPASDMGEAFSKVSPYGTLVSPDGTRWELRADNAGDLSVVALAEE